MDLAHKDMCCINRFDAYREIVGKTFLKIDFDGRSSPDDFSAEFQPRVVGPVITTLARSSGPRMLSAHRDRRHIVTESEDYMVFMVVREGTIWHHQFGRMPVTPPGHMVLLDSREAYRVQHAGSAESLNVRVPTSLMRAALGAPERYCGIAIDGRVGLNAVLADLLLSVWRQAQSFSPHDESVTTTRVVEAIATLCGSIADHSTVRPSARTLHFEQAKRYLESRLSDPTLDPAHVAEALHVSTGHLHAVMRSQGTSIGKLILGMRLDRCRDALANPALHNQTITRIALDWGFMGSAHFSRSFKARFGVTPREYRCRVQQPATEICETNPPSMTPVQNKSLPRTRPLSPAVPI